MSPAVETRNRTLRFVPLTAASSENLSQRAGDTLGFMVLGRSVPEGLWSSQAK